MQVVVGRVVRPHGVRGEAVVEPRTDRPRERFAPGQVLLTGSGRSLTIRSSRPHQQRWLLAFEGVRDRTDVDALRGAVLEVDAGSDPPADEEDVFADADLVGLEARAGDGSVLGVVRSVEHLPMHDLLVVATPDGRGVQVPFASAFVPHIDLERGWLLLDAPPGLLDDEAGS